MSHLSPWGKLLGKHGMVEENFARIFPQEIGAKNRVIAGHVGFSPVSPTPIMMTKIMYI